MTSGSKLKETSNYRVYFKRIFKLQGFLQEGKLELAQITGVNKHKSEMIK